MGHQDFEKYALQRPMNGTVTDVVIRTFDKYAPTQPLIVLDHGCGDGKYFSFLTQRYGVKNVFGCDISALRIKRCRTMGWSQVKVVGSDGILPYPTDNFDLIVSDQVIEHIPEDQAVECFKELRRVLKPRGKLLMITPNYPIKRVYDVINAMAYRNAEMLKDDPTHVAFYNAKRLGSSLGKYFTSVAVIPTGGILFKVFPFVCFSHKLITVAMK